ncbi:MAG: hydratase [Candidatus Fimenecus sp.]
MIKLSKGGAYLINGTELIEESDIALEKILHEYGIKTSREDGKKGTIAYDILTKHNISDDTSDLKIKFDALTSHDITYVGIIQTARASGLTEFPIPYVLTNCHNSLCAVGGTINEDDHMFGLSCAKKYGGVYVPPHEAVIHQFAREMLSGAGKMILGSDSHTRYGALGTMAIGEGGPELVKQLLGRTYDVKMPGVVAVYLKGSVMPGVGPQDVALAIIGAVFANGYVKNKVMEFVGPGVFDLSPDFRIGIDVMTTETTCLSSVWQTDDKIKEFYEIHNRKHEYKTLTPKRAAFYDGVVEVDLSTVKPMIAMPFHPSNTYEIDELNANLEDILSEVEKKAEISLNGNGKLDLRSKVKNGKFYVDQGVIAGCAGGGFENICAAADILNGKSIGNDVFSLSVYPSSMPVYSELVKNGVFTTLLSTGAVLKTCFCGPCFGAGDTPSNNAFSIRHSTRNFPNREGSKIQEGQISSVALMDARSIAATAANGGILTPATEFTGEYTPRKYHFEGKIYDHRVYNGVGNPQKDVDIQFGPNIKDWPEMASLPENLLIKIVSEIHDPVTTTDELIPSGETSSYRSNPLRLAQFALSRRDPAYVGRAAEVQKGETALLAGKNPVEVLPELECVLDIIKKKLSEDALSDYGIGSSIFAVKPGDGSAREQAASCQRVLGGVSNIANEYATKRYRSNLINWGMLPFIIEKGDLPFKNGDYIFVENIKDTVVNKNDDIKAYVVNEEFKEFKLSLGDLTNDEREIIIDGCLINYYRNH